MSKRTNGYDYLVVRTADLSTVVRRWVDAFNADHPRSQEGASNDGWVEGFKPVGFGGQHWIAYHAHVTPRVVSRILGVEAAHTSLSLADDILTAIGRPDLMPEVIPNPGVSQEKWMQWWAGRSCEPWE